MLNLKKTPSAFLSLSTSFFFLWVFFQPILGFGWDFPFTSASQSKKIIQSLRSSLEAKNFDMALVHLNKLNAENRIKYNINQILEQSLLKGLNYLNSHNMDGINEFSSRESLKFLIALIQGAGLDPNVHESYQQPLLHRAISFGDTKMIETLLRHEKIDPNLQDPMGLTPLMMIIEKLSRSSTSPLQKEALIQLVPLLTQNPLFDPNITNRNKKTAAVMAFLAKQYQALEPIVQHPLHNPNLSISNGKSLAMFFIKEKQGNLAKHLIQHPNFNPNFQANNGKTTLMVALEYKAQDLAFLLMNHPQLDPSLRDEAGWTPAMFAVRYGRIAVAKELISNPKFQFNPNTQNEKDQTAAMLATDFGQTELSHFLMQNTDFDFNLTDKNGITLAMLAAIKGDLEGLKILKEKKADFFLKDKEEKTALDHIQGKDHFLQAFKIIDPVNFALKKAETFQTLYRLANFSSNCNPQEAVSHYDINTERKATNCSFCLAQEFQPGERFLKTGTCSCQFCPDCARSIKDQQFHHEFIKDSQCPIHRKVKDSEEGSLPLSFFVAAKASKEELDKFKILALRQKLAEVPGFKFCLTPECINGLVLKTGESKWLNCFLCEKQSLLAEREGGTDGFEDIPDPRSDVRPCPFYRPNHPDYPSNENDPPPCSFLSLVKDDECNHVTCPKCERKCNFEHGREDPKGPGWELFSRKARSFRVPGELIRKDCQYGKTGERFKEYITGVSPDEDLP